MFDAKKLLDAFVAEASEGTAKIRRSTPQGGIADLMDSVLGKIKESGTQAQETAGGPAAGVGDTAKNVLGRATEGVKEVAGKVDDTRKTTKRM